MRALNGGTLVVVGAADLNESTQTVMTARRALPDLGSCEHKSEVSWASFVEAVHV